MNAHVPIREMADFLHSRSNRWKVLALLRAYFDESWFNRSGQITALAGFVADAASWDAFEADWIATWEPFQTQFGIYTFHMTDCRNGTEKFQRIEQHWRFHIINAMSQVIGRHKPQPIWSAVIDDDWHKVVGNAPDFLARYPKPLDLCFDHVVRQMAQWTARHDFDGGVAPMFAEQTEFQPRMIEAYEAWRKHPQFGQFLRPVAFASPSQVKPLQSADMLAYGMGLDNMDNSEPLEPWTLANLGTRRFLHNATEHTGLTVGGCYGEAALRNALISFRETGDKGFCICPNGRAIKRQAPHSNIRGRPDDRTIKPTDTARDAKGEGARAGVD